MLGDGVCRRCRKGHQHVCENRQEVGVRGGRPGALAEQLAVPVTSLHELPDTVDAVLGALVEPGGNSLRSAQAAELQPGDRALVGLAGTHSHIDTGDRPADAGPGPKFHVDPRIG
jgi:threonine dehydrogenase-like Zn-dependent dehydrogenase